MCITGWRKNAAEEAAKSRTSGAEILYALSCDISQKADVPSFTGELAQNELNGVYLLVDDAANKSETSLHGSAN